MLSVFAADAVVIDPHFPAERLTGKVAIAEGFREAFVNTQSFGYTPSACDRIELRTHEDS